MSRTGRGARSAVLLCAALGVGSCGSAATPPPTPSPAACTDASLSGWYAIEVVTGPTVPAVGTLRIRFADGAYQAKGAANVIGGSSLLRDGVLTFGLASMTQVGVDPVNGAAEQWAFRTFSASSMTCRITPAGVATLEKPSLVVQLRPSAAPAPATG